MAVTNEIAYNNLQNNLAEYMEKDDCRKCLKEIRERDRALFSELIKKDVKKDDAYANNIGGLIHHVLNEQ